MCRSCDFLESSKKKTNLFSCLKSKPICTQSFTATPSGTPQHTSYPAVNQVSQQLHTKVVKNSHRKRNLKPMSAGFHYKLEYNWVILLALIQHIFELKWSPNQISVPKFEFYI
jgi:hypothetical protein